MFALYPVDEKKKKKIRRSSGPPRNAQKIWHSTQVASATFNHIFSGEEHLNYSMCYWMLPKCPNIDAKLDDPYLNNMAVFSGCQHILPWYIFLNHIIYTAFLFTGGDCNQPLQPRLGSRPSFRVYMWLDVAETDFVTWFNVKARKWAMMGVESLQPDGETKAISDPGLWSQWLTLPSP